MHLAVQALLDDPHVVVVRHRDCLGVGPIEGRHMQSGRALVRQVHLLPILRRVGRTLLHLHTVWFLVDRLHDRCQVGDFTEDAADVVFSIRNAHKALQICLVLDDAIEHLHAPLVRYTVVVHPSLHDLSNLIGHLFLDEAPLRQSVAALAGDLEPLLKVEGRVATIIAGRVPAHLVSDGLWPLLSECVRIPQRFRVILLIQTSGALLLLEDARAKTLLCFEHLKVVLVFLVRTCLVKNLLHFVHD